MLAADPHPKPAEHESIAAAMASSVIGQLADRLRASPEQAGSPEE